MRDMVPFILSHRLENELVVDDNVHIGSGTKIWHFSHVLPQSKIGQGCNIGQNVVIGPDVEIGDACKIQNNVSIYKGVTHCDGNIVLKRSLREAI